MSGTVVVGLDGSASAALAIRWAWDFARATMRTVRVVHGWRGDIAQVYVPAQDLRREEREAARADARRWIAAVFSHDDGTVPWRLELIEGAPGPALVAAAAADDDCVLVVGTHEHHGIGRVVHGGSISHYVFSHADCPVVAVPPPRPEPVVVYADPSVEPVHVPDVPRF